MTALGCFICIARIFRSGSCCSMFDLHAFRDELRGQGDFPSDFFLVNSPDISPGDSPPMIPL